jgi:AcrR family transcriptional regulator
MGSTERRARERAEMRERILDAARNLFASEGYEAVTLRKVADCIEYCPATIYKYFEDKDEMVRALVEDDIAMVMATIQPSMAEQTPLERLRSFGCAYIDMGLERPNHYRLMFMTPLLPVDDPLFRKKRADPQTDSYGLFLSVVQECIDAGLFRADITDASLVAQTIWAGLHGVISLHIACGGNDTYDWRPVRGRAIFMHDLLINGMLRVPAIVLPTCPSTPSAMPAAASLPESVTP